VNDKIIAYTRPEKIIYGQMTIYSICLKILHFWQIDSVIYLFVLLGIQLLQHLHADNKLSRRFPIGLEEQIKKWDPETIQRFHERWYYPANATLYLVGDIPSVPDAIHHIQAVFDSDRTPPPSPRSPLQNPMAKLFGNNFVSGAMAPNLSKERENAEKSKLENKNAVKRERQMVRPPVEHEWSLHGSACMPKPPQIFQHELIPNFSLNMFAKVCDGI
jgi:Peptidase M16 inactive domain